MVYFQTLKKVAILYGKAFKQIILKYWYFFPTYVDF